MAPSKPFPPGIHVPTLTWFEDTTEQEIDWALQKTHLEFLVNSGISGIVLAGTNGEACTLSPSEKSQLVKLARQTATTLGKPSLTLTMGCSGQSTREVLSETHLAASSGADFAMVLVPSYFSNLMDEAAIVAFFTELADKAPLPVIVYNFPGVVGGLDCHSDILAKLGRHPNIVGVKLTCGGIAKAARVSREFGKGEFFSLAGQSDWLVPALSVGSVGAITGVGNAFPRSVVEAFDLWQAGKIDEAQEAQLRVAHAEWGFGKGGMNGIKWICCKSRGYPADRAHLRRPYPQFSVAAKQEWITETVSKLADHETVLVAKSGGN